MRCQKCHGSGFIEKLIPPKSVTFSIEDGSTIIDSIQRVKESCPDCNGTGDVYSYQPQTIPFILDINQIFDIQIGVTDYMIGRHVKAQKEDPDHQLKKEMSRVLLDIAGESFFPSTQLYQLANALLIENGSEFLLGVTDEEQHFKEWEVERMRGRIEEEVAKVWLNEEKGILCARFPFKQNVIDAIRAEIPKGKRAGIQMIRFGSSLLKQLMLW